MSNTNIETHGRGTGIAPECLQEVLESGHNTAQTGQGQFETPVDFARLCSKPLPRDRKFILDMCAGHGQFLVGAMNATTEFFLASDIEGAKTIQHDGSAKTIRITGDTCKLYGLAMEIDFQNDLTVSNPPYSVHWKRDVLARLAESDMETVRQAFLETDSLSGKGAIDSTAASIMMMLDMFSSRGEGVVICNNSTAERLILNPSAPYRLLATHCWARVALLENPMTGEKFQTFDKEKRYETAVLYFAKSHCDGLAVDGDKRCNDLVEFARATETLSLARSRLRGGPDASGYWGKPADQDELWKSVRSEWDIRQGKKTAEFNIWMTASGEIATYLSIFDSRNTIKIPKEEAQSLFELTGQKPIQLVMQRTERKLLLHHVNGGIWRVDPKLKEAVEAAVAGYHAVRAPLTPLNDVQRLGFLDEEDWIVCKVDLEFVIPVKTEDDEEDADDDFVSRRAAFKKQKRPASPKPPRPTLVFRAGQQYHVRTQSVSVSRTKFKPGMDGSDQEVFLKGAELAIYITDDTGAERCFMDKRLTELGAKIEGDKQETGHGGYKYTVTGEINADFDLQTLVQSFVIPAAPDVAVTRPEAYRAHLTMLDSIEQMVNAKKYII